MEVTSITVGIPVSDLEKATEWYGRLLQKSPGLEPARGVREFEVAERCWLQLTEARMSESENIFRIGVKDIDAERRRLVDIGIEVGEITRIERLIALCDFQDNDGNRLNLYQVLT